MCRPLCYSCFGLLFLVTIASTAQTRFESSVSDYTYNEESNSRLGTPGDGCDERTSWSFDFRGELDSTFVQSLPSLGDLQSASVTIILAPGDEHVQDPRICNLPGSLKIDEVDDHDGIEILDYGTYTFQLLDFYESSLILSRLEQNGQVAMYFESDAKVIAPTVLVLEFEDQCPSASKRLAAAPLIRWSNPAGGPFSDVSNWEGGKSPGRDSIAVFAVGGASYTSSLTVPVTNNRVDADGDLVVIDLGGKTYTLSGEPVLLPGGACATGESIRVLGSSGSSSLILHGGMVEANGDAVIGRGSDMASLTVSSADLQMPDLSTLFVAEAAGSSGSLNIERGGNLRTIGQVTVATEENSGGFVQVQHAGSVLSTPLLVVGSRGRGDVSVLSEAQIEVEFLTVGVESGSIGTVAVSGVGSLLRNVSGAGEYVVGNFGEGMLTVEAGGVVAQDGATTTVLGSKPNSVGVVTLKGAGSSWTSGGLLGIASEGEGRFEILDGANASFQGMAIGGATTASANLTVMGATSTLEVGAVTARMEIASGGIARIEVLSGGVINAGTNLILGAEPGDPHTYGHGDLRVSGMGSKLSLPAAALVLGERGRGSVSIANLGSAELAELWVGFISSVDSTLNRMTVDGGNVVTVGAMVGGAPGVLDVVSSGQVDATFFRIGMAASVHADVNVKDPGSAIRVAESLEVGSHPSSIAVLTIAGGGLVIAGRTTVNGTINGLITVGSPSPKREVGGLRTDTLWIGPGAHFDPDSLITLSNGVVGGDGVFPADYVNIGVLAPGSGLGQVGTFSVLGSYSQTSTGALAVELSGPLEGAYDRLDVRDSVSIGGQLIVKRINGFLPPVGSMFELVRGAHIRGTFETVTIDDFRAEVMYEETSVKLVVTSGVGIAEYQEIPRAIALHQNYPNPFNPTTRITYDLPNPSAMRLSVFDLLGREVQVLATGRRPAGRFEVQFDSHHLPSGIYYYRLQAGDFVATKALVVSK